MLDSRRVGGAALLLLPAALIIFFAFNSGGFYPGPPSYVAILLCIVLVLRVTMAGNPFDGAALGLALATGGLALYALLTLLSQIWSDAPGRALIEFDRVLVYLLVMVLFGSIAHSPDRLRWMLRALALAIVAICTTGLITRLLPHVWPTTPAMATDRLSFPLTYWNALGLLGAFGIVLCLHFSSDSRESSPVRVLAAAAIPVVATTVYFTFSRGGIAVAVIGVVVYVLFARPKVLLSGVIAAAPATAVALMVAYDASQLASRVLTTPVAVAEGRHVAIVVLACSATGAILRGFLVWTLDPRLERISLADRTRVRARRLFWAAAAVGVLISVVALNGAIVRQYRRFVSPAAPGNVADLRARLTDPGNNGRIDMWRVGWHQFERAPILGHGAGTFENTWAEYRPTPDFVQDAHSLYIETLDELGIVGFVLLVGVIVALLIGTAGRARGPERPVYAAAFAVMLIWAVHAGIDWDWEMPVVTLPFFALGGFMLARPPARSSVGAPTSIRAPTVAPAARLVVGALCLLLAVAPAYVWLSQRRLDQATAAFARGDCRSATRAALSSISILGDRPEPYEVLGYCDIRRDMPNLAIASIQKAISLDPTNWNFRYDLAVMQASAGLDPMPAARQAFALDPREPLVQNALKTFSADNRSQWEADGKTIANAFTSL